MMKKQKHLQNTTIIIGPMAFSFKVVTPYLKDPTTKLIFVDGGLTHFPKFKLKAPVLAKEAQSMGDGDSSKRPMTFFKGDQNLSDLSYCMKLMGKKKNAGTFLFVGFLGGRLDHQFFNLGEISRFVKKDGPRLLLENKIEFFAAGKISVEIHGVFSLGSFEDNQIKIDGACLYKSKKWIDLPTLSSRGLSNVGSGRIDIVTKTPLALFYS